MLASMNTGAIKQGLLVKADFKFVQKSDQKSMLENDYLHAG